MRPRILLLGRSGQVGGEVLPLLAKLGEVVAPGRELADLSKPDTLVDLVASMAPQVIVNAAAYTAVDKAESEEELAFQVNAYAPAILAKEAARRGALLVHYSTDYVFPGDRPANAPAYREVDDTGPLGVYGKSKLAGEMAVRSAGGDHAVLRTAWVYAAGGKNFVNTMRRLASERDTLKVVADQIGTPTWAADIATITAVIVQRFLASGKLSPSESGIFHCVSSGRTSWHGFAKTIMEAARQAGPVSVQRIEPITSAEFPTPAQRPAFSVLDTERLRNAFGLTIGPWEDRFQAFLKSESEK